MKESGRLFELIKGNSEVTFKLEGCGEETFATEEFRSDLDEMRRLIKIGQATEKAFALGLTIDAYAIEIYDIEDLLEWAEED